MPPEVWDHIISKLSSNLVSSSLTAPLIPQLHRWVLVIGMHSGVTVCAMFPCREVKTSYEETIRKTTIRMTLVKPAVHGMEPEPSLYKEKE